jgi:hypothetical protein
VKRVYKYDLWPPAEGQVTLQMPIGAEPLYVAEQVRGTERVLCLWALVDTDEDALREPRNFFIVGTGHPITFEDSTY